MNAPPSGEFSEPIYRLISLVEDGIDNGWMEYSNLELTSEHVPELIRVNNRTLERPNKEMSLP